MLFTQKFDEKPDHFDVPVGLKYGHLDTRECATYVMVQIMG